MCPMLQVGTCIFFFKQKTAYEMRISDWSSDVCSSDLDAPQLHSRAAVHLRRHQQAAAGRLARDSRSRPARPPPGAAARVLVGLAGGRPGPRSEEHTSELQSLMRISYAVCCLKKNNTRS